MIDIFVIQQKNDLKVVIFLKFNNIFLNNLALKTLRRRYKSTGRYEMTKTSNNIVLTVSTNGVNFSEIKGWEKIPEGENIDKQIEIGVHQRI